MFDFERFRNDVLALGLLALVVFVGLSFLSYDPADPPSDLVFPARNTPINICGSTGAAIAFHGRQLFGAGVWMVMAFLSGQIFMGILGAIFFAISIRCVYDIVSVAFGVLQNKISCLSLFFPYSYAKMVWSRIPFATANLVTACTAIKANLGVTFFAYLFTAVAGVWSITWSIAFAGVFDKTYECDEQDVCTDPNYGILFLLFVAYFFIHQVLQVPCIVSVVIGSIWLNRELILTSFCVA